MTGENEADDVEVTDPENEAEADDPGPGWMPAVLAATALMGIIGFIACGFSTWILFQKRTEFAIRTLKGAYIAEIEQSLLDPESKAAVMDEVKSLASDLERGKYEDWQAAGIMQRLQRLPVIQWGELQAVESYLRKSDGQQADQIKQLTRLRRGVQMGKVTSFDIEDVLKPIRRIDSSSPSGQTMVQPLTDEKVKDVIHRARLLADQFEVPDQSFENIAIEAIVRREIKQGAAEGGF